MKIMYFIFIIFSSIQLFAQEGKVIFNCQIEILSLNKKTEYSENDNNVRGELKQIIAKFSNIHQSRVTTNTDNYKESYISLNITACNKTDIDQLIINELSRSYNFEIIDTFILTEAWVIKPYNNVLLKSFFDDGFQNDTIGIKAMLSEASISGLYSQVELKEMEKRWYEEGGVGMAFTTENKDKKIWESKAMPIESLTEYLSIRNDKLVVAEVNPNYRYSYNIPLNLSTDFGELNQYLQKDVGLSIIKKKTQCKMKVLSFR